MGTRLSVASGKFQGVLSEGKDFRRNANAPVRIYEFCRFLRIFRGVQVKESRDQMVSL